MQNLNSRPAQYSSNETGRVGWESVDAVETDETGGAEVDEVDEADASGELETYCPLM